MDHLMTIFLQRLPTVNIDTLEKVFDEAIIFTKKANPYGGGLMVLAQVTIMIQTYPARTPLMPNQFILATTDTSYTNSSHNLPRI